MAQLERELVAREGQLSGQAGELAALQEAQRDAHAQMNQYVMDLQVGTACQWTADNSAMHSVHSPRSQRKMSNSCSSYQHGNVLDTDASVHQPDHDSTTCFCTAMFRFSRVLWLVI